MDLQLAYAETRVAYPIAAVITIEVVGHHRLCQVVQVRDRAGRVVWSLWDTDETDDDRFGPVEELLAEVIRVGGVAGLPGWTDRGGGGYDVDLGGLLPALDPDLSGSDADVPGLVSAVAAVLDEWFRTRCRQLGICTGLLEGRFAPLTDIARWPIVPAALGHPVPDGYDSDRFRPDEEDWTIGIASVHALTAGVVLSRDTSERYGTEDDLHLGIYVSSTDLAPHGLTVGELATAFEGDVHRTAAAILHALPRDQAPTFPPMVPCTGCGHWCVLATAHRHAPGSVGNECCWTPRTEATNEPAAHPPAPIAADRCPGAHIATTVRRRRLTSSRVSRCPCPVLELPCSQ